MDRTFYRKFNKYLVLETETFPMSIYKIWKKNIRNGILKLLTLLNFWITVSEI